MDIGATEVIIAMLAALNVGGILGTLVGKKVSSKKEEADSKETLARRESLAVETAEKVIQIVRDDLIAKVEDNSQLREQNAHLKTSQEELSKRVEKLEERERHGLVRAAIHEAWDQMAFAKLSSFDGAWPPPPPLTVISELEERSRTGGKQIDEQLGDSGLPDPTGD